MIKMSEVVQETCNNENEERLFRAVIRQTGAGWREIYSRPENFRNASYGVSGFIYYRDTEKFAKKYISEILDCLTEFESECGTLEKDDCNKLNWLAWFALEYIIDKVMMYKENQG